MSDDDLAFDWRTTGDCATLRAAFGQPAEGDVIALHAALVAEKVTQLKVPHTPVCMAARKPLALANNRFQQTQTSADGPTIYAVRALV